MVSTGDLFGAEGSKRTPRGMIPRWAERYGYSVRLIKKWLAAGRELGDMPPLEEPDKMADWAERVLGSVPKRLSEALETIGAPPPEKAAPEEVAPEVFEVPSVRDDELGIEQQLENFRREMVVLQKMRRTALERSEMSRADAYLVSMNKVSQEIRQLEKMLPSLLRERGDLKSTDEVRRETVAALKVLRTALFSRGQKARSRFAKSTDEEEAGRIFVEEIDTAFRDACDAGFAEQLTLEA